MKKETIKRYLFSSLITFISGFVLAILPQLQGIDAGSLQDGVLTGILFAGARAGIKGVIEMAVTWYKTPFDSVDSY